MYKAINKQFLDILLKQEIITPDQHKAFIERDFKTLPDLEVFIRQQAAISEEQLAQVKAELYNVEYAQLVGQTISTDVIGLLSRDISENYMVVVFDRTDSTIKVGLVHPGNFKAIEAVDFMAHKNNLHAQYYAISIDSFRAAMKQYGTIREEVGEALDTAESIFGPDDQSLLKSDKSIDEMIRSAPVTKIISVVLRHAIEGRASDIHIEPVVNQSRIRYRIDGVLHTTIVLPIYVHAALVSRIKVMAKLKIDETRVPQDGRIRLNIFNKDVDFRVSTLPLMGQEKVVMRILTTPDKAPTLEDLGFYGMQLAVMKKNMKKPNGMFLVTGPTGSGKSTTLFAILSKLNVDSVNIMTLEDPVEYFIAGVNQSSIRPEVGYTFANGLRSFLRQDPNIIMVGEIRDKETASLAVQASLTGHFLLSTLHTNSAVGAIPRLFDMKVEPFLLGNTLNVVIAQRLVRKICKNCKTTSEISQELLGRVQEEFDKIPEKAFYGNLNRKSDLVFYKGKGCPRCGNTGYSGRSTIVEVIDVTSEMRDIIMTGFHSHEVQDALRKQKYITMKQDGILKTLLGITTLDEVLMASEM